MKQVLAVIVAVALVGGAYYVRTEFIAPDSSTAQDDDGGGSGDADAVACDEHLGAACPAGAARLGPAQLIEAFSTPTPEHDVLVAPSIVVDMIVESGRFRASFDDAREVVATTPMVLVVAAGRTGALGECASSVTWACAAELVAEGQLRPGLDDPAGTSNGLAALAALAGGYFDDADAPYNLNGFNTGGFIGWLDAVDRESRVGSGAVENIIRFAGAQNDSAVVTEAAALDVVNRAAQNVPEVTYPEPVASLSVVAVAVGETDPRDAATIGGEVGDALRGAGWRGPDGVPPEGATDGAPDLPDDDGLPSGGVMVALRGRWTS